LQLLTGKFYNQFDSKVRVLIRKTLVRHLVDFYLVHLHNPLSAV
jgi:hypothetical protein